MSSIQLIASMSIPSGGGGVNFSDDFVRPDSESLGPNWTEVVGNFDINSNAMRFRTASFAKQLAVYSGQATDTVDQYSKVAFPTLLGSVYPEMAFRYTDSSTQFYSVQLLQAENQAKWQYYSSSAASSSTIATAALTVDSGDSFGITLEGTGTSTVVRIWRNPTGGIPDSATSWGGDATPDVTFTTDPGTPVNTGNYIGVMGYQNAVNTIIVNAFFGGDIP